MASALSVLAYGVMLATDGAATSTGEKVGRLSVLLPLVGALAAWLANAQARWRGESHALAATGVHPSRACLGTLLAAGLTGAVGAGLLASGVGEVDGLFPRVDQGAWEPAGDGWVLREAGVRVLLSGMPRLEAVSAGPQGWAPPHRAVVASVCWTTVVLVDWVRDEIGAWQRLSAILAAGGVAIVLFHLVAAGRVTGWVLLGAPLPLLGHAWGRRAWRHWTRPGG